MERMRERRRRSEARSRFRFVSDTGSHVIEVDLIVTRWKRWLTMAESASPAWSARRVGSLAVALRVMS